VPVAPFRTDPAALNGSDALVADAVVPLVGIYAKPGDPNPEQFLRNPTIEKVPLVLGVKSQVPGWLEVQIPVRPNETTGWVRTTEVKTRTVPNHILVELGKHKLTVFKGNEVLYETAVGVGKANTPSPTGSFYVDVAMPFKNSGGAYGAFMLSVAGFSNVIKSFAGGRGQIAIHGTNARWSVGVDSSHGCLRLTNESVLKVASLAPTGTPVEILP
jgi:lipoprotein-anchoring transpeptidase ErfK/SrfK